MHIYRKKCIYIERNMQVLAGGGGLILIPIPRGTYKMLNIR